MNASAPGLSRPQRLSLPSWTAMAIVAATAAAGAALLFALPSEPATAGSAISGQAPTPTPQAGQPATAALAAEAGTSVPDAAAAFRAREPADEPMAPTF